MRGVSLIALSLYFFSWWGQPFDFAACYCFKFWFPAFERLGDE
jgi:hypothetical protein